MLILLTAMLGVVALPFVVLMAPVLLWMAIPAAVFFGGRYGLKTINHHAGWHGPSSPHPSRG